MRIGIVGAPGAGKSEFAQALAEAYDLTIIDDYVSKLQEDTDLALGMWASYAENFMVAGVRMAEEYLHPEQNRITVGTVLDTLAYSAVKSDVVLQDTATAVRATYVAAQGAMSGLSLMYAETWDYHISFFLPLPDEMEASWKRTLDEGYRIMIDSYQVPYLYTLKGSAEERIKIAKEILDIAYESRKENAATATETSEVNESAIRPRSGGRPEVGDSPDSVSDLSDERDQD